MDLAASAQRVAGTTNFEHCIGLADLRRSRKHQYSYLGIHMRLGVFEFVRPRQN